MCRGGDLLQFEEEVCIVSGDNRAWSEEPKTVVELWCRSKKGYSVLLLVNGLRPYVEISAPNSPDMQPDSEFLLSVSSVKGVQGNPEPSGMKLCQDGVIRPHFRVYVRDTTKVRGVRNCLLYTSPSPRDRG